MSRHLDRVTILPHSSHSFDQKSITKITLTNSANLNIYSQPMGPDTVGGAKLPVHACSKS